MSFIDKSLKDILNSTICGSSVKCRIQKENTQLDREVSTLAAKTNGSLRRINGNLNELDRISVQFTTQLQSLMTKTSDILLQTE